MINTLLLKALHSNLQLAIIICDASFTVINEFQSDKTNTLYYNHYHMLNTLSESETDFLFYHGPLGEMFLIYHIDNHYITIGPWRSNAIDKLSFKKEMMTVEISKEEQDYLFRSLSKLPFLPLSQIRELLILVNYCLTGTVEDRFSEPLHRYADQWNTQFDLESIHYFFKNITTSYTYLYNYENAILRAVKKGDLVFLKETVNQLSNVVTPSVSGSQLRSEKNYSILVFDRLAQGAIQAGLDVETAYRSRDQFIKDNESSEMLTQVLQLRDAAVVFYTKQIEKINNQLVSASSPIIIAIIQQLKNNLNSNIKTSDIARQFHMSESKLRKIFKEETHVTIQQYFLNLKIEAAKQLLSEGITLTQIAETFAFSSPSNFSRTFKKLVGMSPTDYVQMPRKRNED
ncbi:YSIRK-targeted surface antigen transcriptional regulator [Streptococcus castoreus]|uniref:YSIRK-targeted surface antigen transcriptional regulator n=1 Tax=Streptococcus castoreus TaxID=254786 RepID=UPI000407AFF7|nr:YSIRK-targeted surface antigen transcriptional regulator [Streptococcus castoreus]